MYLKRIEVQGFKSFANKITFKFHNGITGIVGPNGSGKSNVADAVRWVLGEQRIKQLRGASMQDVIFSGTQMRKPQSYAYVAITLDNSDHQLAIDYDEVTVSRRLYRSGESEYMINGTLCRLKDVNELFYDTGIGKEGYSIIGQGQIDRILSGKPEERRELFDEAAGIVKFKKRKAISVKKLEDEKQNLVRVNDILSELEKQIGPLEKQSEKAKIYLRKKEALKEYDVNVFLLENVRIREQLEGVVEKYKIASTEHEQTKTRYDQIKVDYEEIQQQIEELEKQINEAKESLSDAGVTRSKLEGEINLLKEQIHSAKGNEAHLQHRIQTIQGQIDEKNVEYDTFLAEKKDYDAKLQELESAKEETHQLLLLVQEEITQLNADIENNKNTIIKTLNNRATIKSRMARLDSVVEQNALRKAELNARLLRAKSDEAKQVETIKELEEKYEALTKELEEDKRKQNGLEEEIAGMKSMLAEKDKQLRETQAKYHQDKSKLEALSNLTERYEGYGGSVKAVMEHKESEKGIIGVVADIIHVQKEYETAIETALGGNIQNVVTEDEETAKRMIGILKKNRNGRATFLPLTSITHPQEFKTPEVLEEKGVIGMADALVQTDKKYRNVAKAMLGRIVVVDHVDHAVKIARKYDYGIRMVTLEGELLVPGGAISGGAFKNNSNLLSRRREIEDFEKRVKEASQRIKEIQQEIEDIKSHRNQLRMELEGVKAQSQMKVIAQNTARISVEQAKERQGEQEESYSVLKDEQKEIEAKMQEVLLEKDEITNELSDSEQLEKQMQEKIGALQQTLQAKREEETKVSVLVGEKDVAVEKYRQTVGFKQENLSRVEHELQRLKGELSEVENGLKQGVLDVEFRTQSIAELEKTIAASYTAQSETEKALKQNMERKEILSGRQKNFFASREELAEKIAALDKEVYRLSAQKEKLEGSIESQINYMWDEYEITLSDAAHLRNEEMTDLSAMKQEIASLKDQIKKLGDVNVNAIEDYKNLMERYDFLKKQHDDLVLAEETLQGIIDDLDTNMRRQFQEKFAEINREFDKVFKELFGGGKGTLELMEDEDILEAGIRIIAQPPGKKLVNMMQMSGGEKALTAICLLFAIQNLKPSPFCLLDEIEAALDESNVSRFAGYLHKLTKNTQFIVITHRRGTMEKVDRLYGITMQEKGISALVSVKLIDKDLED